MTSSMPSGDGTVTSSPADTELDTEAVPEAGLEPDTAAGAARGTDSPAGSDAPAAHPGDDTGADRAGDLTEIDGPALENDEMRRGTDDLRSSERKTAEAEEIAGQLRAQTLPGAATS